MATSLKRQSDFTTQQTYSIAHSAQCKLHIAANRPDRNLRFVLGHAFTLDKVLLRIVEIENYSAKDQFNNSQPSPDNVEEPMGSGVRVGETGSLANPQRRISFSNQAKPSDITGGNSGPKPRAKSPPPQQTQKKQIRKGYEDEDSTSSDDYDEPDTFDYARATNPKSAVHPPANAEDDHDDDGYVDDYDDAGDDTGLGLTRFASATAAAPRERPQSPPPLSESDSEEDDEPPKSPPAFPDDVVRGVMVEGEEVKELNDLYETIRGCPCKRAHGVVPESKGMWEIKSEGEDGKTVRYGVVKV